jgi:quercetin dioxygenase-like cupin family protein
LLLIAYKYQQEKIMPSIQLENRFPAEPIPGFQGRFIHSENMTVADWKIKEGSTSPEHSHPQVQIAFILDGMFELTLEGESMVLTPGTVAIIPSNMPHVGKALTECRLLDIFYPVREDLRQLTEPK